MTKPELKLDPVKDCVPAGKKAELDVVVRVRVPEADGGAEAERPPLNLALVIDRSGSMAGRPLAEAKACAKRIVEGLRPGDRVAVVAYDNQAQVVSPSTDAAHKREVLGAIEAIRERGMTNLHGGWLAGAEQVAEHLSKAAVNRVILLSDGQQNQGVTDPAEIARQCAVMADKGVETSTYGLGLGFNEDLMADMAAQGQGNAYYGETAEDLAPSFEAEFGILSRTVGKNVRLELAGKKGARAEVLNAYRKDGDAWILPNLVAGAEVWAAVRLTVDGLKAVKGKAKLLEATLRWDAASGEAAAPVAAALKLPVVESDAFERAPVDARPAERVKEAEAARIQLDAKAAARRGDWGGVDRAVADLRSMSGSNAYVGEVAEQLSGLAAMRDGNLLSKELTVSASVMSTRYAAVDERVDSLADAQAPAFLRRQSRQGKRS